MNAIKETRNWMRRAMRRRVWWRGWNGMCFWEVGESVVVDVVVKGSDDSDVCILNKLNSFLFGVSLTYFVK